MMTYLKITNLDNKGKARRKSLSILYMQSVNNIAQMIDSLSMKNVRSQLCLLHLNLKKWQLFKVSDIPNLIQATAVFVSKCSFRSILVLLILVCCFCLGCSLFDFVSYYFRISYYFGFYSVVYKLASENFCLALYRILLKG